LKVLNFPKLVPETTPTQVLSMCERVRL